MPSGVRGGRARSLLAAAAGQAGEGLLAFLFVPIFLHLLGEEGWGLVALVPLANGLLAVVGFPLSTAVNRELARLGAAGASPSELGHAVGTIELVFDLAAVAVIAVAWFAAPWIVSHWIRPETLAPSTCVFGVRLVGFYAAAILLRTGHLGALFGMHRHVEANSISFGTALASSTAGLLVAGPLGQGVLAFLAAQTLVQAAGVAFAGWRAHSALDTLARERFGEAPEDGAPTSTQARSDAVRDQADSASAAPKSQQEPHEGAASELEPVMEAGLIPRSEIGPEPELAPGLGPGTALPAPEAKRPDPSEWPAGARASSGSRTHAAEQRVDPSAPQTAPSSRQVASPAPQTGSSAPQPEHTRLRPSHWRRADREAWQRLWPFIRGLMLVALASGLVSQMDKLVVSRLLPLGGYGLYVAAATLASAVALLVRAVNIASFPDLSRVFAGGGSGADDAGATTAQAEALHRWSQAAALIVLPAGATLAAFAREALLLWLGPEGVGAAASTAMDATASIAPGALSSAPAIAASAAEAAAASHAPAVAAAPTTAHASDASVMPAVVAALAAGWALNGIAALPFSAAFAAGWTRFALVQNLIALAFLPLTMALLVPSLGAPGAALAWTALNAFYVFVAIPTQFFRRILPSERWKWFVGDAVIPVAAAGIAVALLRWALPHAESRFAAAGWLVGSGSAALAAVLAACPHARGAMLSRTVRSRA